MYCDYYLTITIMTWGDANVTLSRRAPWSVAAETVSVTDTESSLDGWRHSSWFIVPMVIVPPFEWTKIPPPMLILTAYHMQPAASSVQWFYAAWRSQKCPCDTWHVTRDRRNTALTCMLSRGSCHGTSRHASHLTLAIIQDTIHRTWGCQYQFGINIIVY